MKKKILSVILAAITVFSLAVPAMGAGILSGFYPIWINNTQITDTNKNDVLKDGGSVKFDSETYTLTLTDATVKATGLRNSGITVGTSLEDPVEKLNIELVGDSHVYGNANSSTALNMVCAGLNCYYCREVNFCGKGTATFTGYENSTYTPAGIYGNTTTKVNVESGTVKIVGKNFKYYQFTDNCAVAETSDGFTVTHKASDILSFLKELIEIIGNFFISIGRFIKNLF